MDGRGCRVSGGTTFGAMLLFALCGSVSLHAQGPSALPDAPMPHVATAAAVMPEPSDKDEPVTLRKLPLRFVTDEAHIFTSPARIRTHDLKWLLPLAAATAVSLSTDSYTMRHVVTQNPSVNNASARASDVLLGTAIAAPVLMYTFGEASEGGHIRETGVLGGEALVDAYVFDEIIKYATLRERPQQDNANGKFFIGNAVSSPSFVSGHSILTWSSAAVLAEEYHKPWQQATIYTLAAGVPMTRVLGQQHFPTDVLLGSAAGWLIGHYVYRAHHRPFIGWHSAAKVDTVSTK